MTRRARHRNGGAAMALLVLAACGPASPGPDLALEYMGRGACVDCHADVVDAWTGSDHDRAMDHATPETVLGDFANVTLSRNGVETRFNRRGGRFWIMTDGEDGATAEFEILYTFGVQPLQQYLVETEQGRLQRLPWSWDSRRAEEGGQRWFHIYGDEPIGSDDVLHWTRPSQNWNRMCADCHSTNLVKAYDADSEQYATTWSEIDVSCEACHGPASAHLAWAEERDAGVAGSGTRPANLGFPVPFEGPGDGGWTRAAGEATAHRTVPVANEQGLEQCASCHAHRTPISEREAGAAFDDSYRLSLPRPPLYYADGQVREEVFVYGSLLQSKMYRQGVTCVNCHEPHTAELRAEGNALCTQCHSTEVFDGPQHHRHEQGTEGAACVDCHMPETTFMQLDARRDHGFRVPRPLVGDAPNACTACHGNRDTAWVSSTLDDWYGAPSDSSRFRVARTFAAADRGDAGAATELARIVADTAHNPIVRATAVSYLDRFPSAQALSAARSGATDADPLVRAQATQAFRMLQPAERVPLATPLLDDPSLLVRIAAARALAPATRSSLSEHQRALLERAEEEFDRSRLLNADDPAATVELADARGERGQLYDAELGYRRALDLEPGFLPAYLNLADLYRATNRENDARDVLATGHERAPGEPVLAYALGLLHVRADRLEEAVEFLEMATSLDRADPRYPVALALTLQRAGRPDDAAAVLERAAEVADPSRDVLVTLVALYRDQGQLDRARVHARTLETLYPTDESVAALLNELGVARAPRASAQHRRQLETMRTPS